MFHGEPFFPARRHGERAGGAKGNLPDHTHPFNQLELVHVALNQSVLPLLLEGP